MAQQPATAELAEFAANLTFDDLPDDVVDRVECMILDSLGIAHFVADRTPWGRVVTVVASETVGKSQIIGFPGSASPSMAALANGTLTMGFEFEDMHARGTGHPFSIVFPAALAAAEAAEKSGADFIAALVAGYEVAVRSSFGMSEGGQSPWVERGVYPITMFGVLGAAAAAGNALGLDSSSLLDAIGIAGSQAFGTMQAHKEGSMTRRLHAGRAAETGVTAAILAERGFDGPSEAVEGEFGIYRAFGGGVPDLTAVTQGIGSDWQVHGAWLKNYPCNGLFQAPIEGLLTIMAENEVDSADIERVKVSIARATPLHERPSSVTPVNAQFSLHYCMALTLIRGRPSAEMFLEPAIADEDVIEAMSRIDVNLDPVLNRKFPGSARPGRVEVIVRDRGRFVAEVPYPKGHPKNPMTWADVASKFAHLMSLTAAQGVAMDLEQRVRKIHESSVVPRLSLDN